MVLKRSRRSVRGCDEKRLRPSTGEPEEEPECCFCGVKGSRRACQGTILGPFSVVNARKTKLKVYAHRNCAIWAPEVWEEYLPEKKLVKVLGVPEAYLRSRRSKCMICKQNGASLACLLKGKACCRNLHFYCALISETVLLPWTAYIVLCPKHKDRNLDGEFVPYPMRQRYAQTPVPPKLLDSETAPHCNKCEEDNFMLERGSLLICGACGSGTHARCLEPQIMMDGQASVHSAEGTYRCENCKQCGKCGEPVNYLDSRDTGQMTSHCEHCAGRGFQACKCGLYGDHVACILCHNTYHIWCIEGLPNDGKPFRCTTCRICEHCDKLDQENWDESTLACGSCSARHKMGHICPACEKVYPEEDSEPMVWCDYCSRWFHGQCGGLDDKAFAALEASDEKWACESCSDELKVPATQEKPRSKRNVRSKSSKMLGSRSTLKTKPLDLSAYESEESEDDDPEELQNGREFVLVPQDGKPGTLGAAAAPKVDICFVCGSGGSSESFRFCYDCGEAYHCYCLTPPLPMREYRPRTDSVGTLYRLTSGACSPGALPWRCWKCVRCEVCSSSAADPAILMCDHCDRGFNLNCLSPPLLEVPEGAFTCPECSVCELCKLPTVGPNRIDNRIFCEECSRAVRSSPPCPICDIRYPAYPSNTTFIAGHDGTSLEASNYQVAAHALRCSSCLAIVHGECDEAQARKLGQKYLCAVCRGEPVRMSEVSDFELGNPTPNGGIVFPPEPVYYPPRRYQLPVRGDVGYNSASIDADSDAESTDTDEWEIGQDERKCFLCHAPEGAGDDGRLLPWGNHQSVKGDVWVHVLCALWSNEFYLSRKRPGLLHVRRSHLMLRIKKARCVRCGFGSATVVCSAKGCSANYHYGCAVEDDCRFIVDTKEDVRKTPGVPVPIPDVEDLRVLCSYHSRNNFYSTYSQDPVHFALEVDLKYPIKLDVPPVALRKKLPPVAGIRVGSLTVVRIGDLRPRSEAFVVNNALIPSGYRAVRRYWSMSNPGRRTEYIFEIGGDDMSGPKWKIRVADEPEWIAEGNTASETWSAVKKRLKYRKLLMTPEDAFGAASVKGVISMIEGLPFAQMFVGRYKFWYVRPEKSSITVKPPEQPLINDTGSARTEGYIPRRLLGAWLYADPLPPTYFNAPTGRLFQFQVAMEDSAKSDAEQNARSRNDDKVARPFSQTEHRGKARQVSSGTTTTTLPVAMQYRAMLKTWRRRTRVLRSNIDGWGVFATEDIKPMEMVIEYAGEVVRPSVGDIREKNYDKKGIGCYLFRIQGVDQIVDATMGGNDARFINHSCDPNCFSKTVVVEGGRRVVVIFTKRFVAKGEELTYDYLFEFDEEDRQPCKCGAAKCRRWMN